MEHESYIKSLSERLNLSEEKVAEMASQFVSTFMKEVREGGLLSIQGFGNFEMKEKAERKMYNPTTKSYKVIPSKKVIGFKMSATLKGRINN